MSVVAEAVREVSITAVAVVTVTVSATPDTFIATGRVTAWPTVSDDVLLDVGREPGERARHAIIAGRKLQEHEAAVGFGHERPPEVRVEVARFDGHSRQAGAGRVGDRALNDPGGDLLCRRAERVEEKSRENDQGTE